MTIFTPAGPSGRDRRSMVLSVLTVAAVLIVFASTIRLAAGWALTELVNGTHGPDPREPDLTTSLSS